MLYGTQGGNCNGCGTHFMPQHLTVDHIIARSKGGTGHLDNLQLCVGTATRLRTIVRWSILGRGWLGSMRDGGGVFGL